MINWTKERIKVEHLVEYARYRKKVGDLEAYDLISTIIRGLSGTITFSEVAGPQPDQNTWTTLKAAGAFVLGIYAELEVNA